MLQVGYRPSPCTSCWSRRSVRARPNPSDPAPGSQVRRDLLEGDRSGGKPAVLCTDHCERENKTVTNGGGTAIAVGATVLCKQTDSRLPARRVLQMRKRGKDPADIPCRRTCRPPLARWRNPMSGLQQVPSPTEASVDHPVIPRGRRGSRRTGTVASTRGSAPCFTPATCPLGRDDHVTHSPRASRRCRPADDRRLGLDLHARGSGAGRPDDHRRRRHRVSVLLPERR